MRAGFARRGGSQMTRDLGAENTEQVRAGLVELGVPTGLASTLAQEDRRIGLRIYLLDNSGSMNSVDGTLIKELPGGRIQQQTCTRWEEICSFAKDHARWNLATGVPAEFVLLNSAGRMGVAYGSLPQEGIDYVRVDRNRPTSMDDLDRLLRNNTPRGGTPITARLQEIGSMIHQEVGNLASQGQMVFLTLATDGVPTDHAGNDDRMRLINEIKRLLHSLPVQMVIRLCTDEPAVVQFYNSIDEECELALDIIDDFESEAKEIAASGNDFFVYTTTIQRIREAGTLCKLMDSIDEQTLNPTEMRRFIELLSGDDALSRCGDNKSFVVGVKSLVSRRPAIYDPVARTMRPFLNIRAIKRGLKVGVRVNLFPCLL